MTYPIKVVPYNVMVHPDGRTASVTGAHPGGGFEMQQRGWTCENNDGTRGCGKKPWRFYEAAQAYVDAFCPPEMRQADAYNDVAPNRQFVQTGPLVQTFRVDVDLSCYDAMVAEFDLTAQPSKFCYAEFGNAVLKALVDLASIWNLEVLDHGIAFVVLRVPDGYSGAIDLRKSYQAQVILHVGEALSRAGRTLKERLKLERR